MIGSDLLTMSNTRDVSTVLLRMRSEVAAER